MVPVFILEDVSTLGGVSRWWLAHSLRELQRDLGARGGRLIFRKGNASAVLMRLVKETKADAVLWDESFEPLQRESDAAIRERLSRVGVFCDALNDSLLFDPARILNKQGTPYKVFTPFFNYYLSLEETVSFWKFPAKLSAPARWPRSEAIDAVGVKLYAAGTGKMRQFWTPGARGAATALREFLDKKIDDYPEERDHPASDGTSRLSPHLHFGEISVRRIWEETRKHMASDRRPGVVRAAEIFLRQIVWREFAHYLLYHFPATVSEPLRKEFSRFSWRKNARLFRAWQEGETGYPIVDAGMRQLRATGWMHNRVRMIAASFLVKDLLQPWQDGAAWFMAALADADLANNVFGWQWVAGCGADAAPYFRIFNPVLQGERFDPRGDYVRRWVPELFKMPGQFIHSPWLASPEVLAKAGVSLGKNYPVPLVDHGIARKRALFAYDRLKGSLGK